jgi:transposase
MTAITAPLWALTTGPPLMPWRDVPPAYGPWQTVYGLFRCWQRDGTWRAILTALQGRADAAGLITWDVSVDSTVARAHQHAAGARRRGDLQADPPGGVTDEPADHGPGRSRGGLTTKVHLACEQGQKPLSVVITAGQRGDSPQFQVVLGRIRVPRPGRGRPRTRPDRVLADKAYGSRAYRAYLRRRGIRCTIPEKADQIRHRKAKGAKVAVRPPSTPKITRPAMPWNAASTGSSATAPWPPATTSWPSATKPPSASPRSTNGSYPTFETRPRWLVSFARGGPPGSLIISGESL